MAYEWPNHPVALLLYCVNDFEGQNTFYQLGVQPDPWNTTSCASHKASLFSFLKKELLVQERNKRQELQLWKENVQPMEGWMNPNILAGDISLNAFKAKLTLSWENSNWGTFLVRRCNINMKSLCLPGWRLSSLWTFPDCLFSLGNSEIDPSDILLLRDHMGQSALYPLVETHTGSLFFSRTKKQLRVII